MNETSQAGWTQVTANQTIEINGTSLTLVNQNFTNTQQLGNLSGYKVNGTGTGLEGWTITLNNQTLGSFINQTNNSGAFSFTDIPWGIYQLNETPQAGWTQVTANQTIEINGTSLTLVNQNFTNTQQLGNVTGDKVDFNGTGLGGWTITLNNQTLGSFINQTNSSGAFSFTDIPWGIYQLNETPQAGWTQVTANQTIEINGTSMTLVNQNFTNIQQLGNLSGYKVNGTGTGLEGWTITLNNQTLGSFINQTNSSGAFSFTDIPWGIYQLNETPQVGWTQVTANQTIEINGTSMTLVNQNFTNIQQLGNLSGTR